ncbi:MAG TPA: DedA family protein [Acidimicrobiales bacterium]|nr:DedA family protein [Acidimicrobiales bacterium]
MLAFLSSNGFITSGGYLAIFVLCVAQSCCIPTSSELTMGLAGVLAAQGKLSLPGVIIVGVVGELIGAVIAWWIGRVGGRPFVTRWGRYVLITRTDLNRAEAWYNRHRRGGVFIGRVLPVIRSFVAIVAGISEVPITPFVIFTALGSLVWLGLMAGIGYSVGSNYKSITKGFSDVGYVLVVIVVIAVAVLFVHRLRTYRHLREMEDREDALADAAAGGAVAARVEAGGAGSAGGAAGGSRSAGGEGRLSRAVAARQAERASAAAGGGAAFTPDSRIDRAAAARHAARGRSGRSGRSGTGADPGAGGAGGAGGSTGSRQGPLPRQYGEPADPARDPRQSGPQHRKR